jgi:hypothetical protein
MALIAESKIFDAPDEDGTQNVSLTSSVWGSEAPKTHFLFGMAQSAATIETSMKNSIGWSDGTDNVAIGNGSQNGVGTSVANRTHQTAYTAHPLSNNGGTYERAVQSSYTNAPRVGHTWSNSANDGYYYYLMALGGSDVENVSIDVVTSPTSTGDVSYTGPGFEPDLLLVFSSAGHTSGLPASSVHSVQMFGFSDGTTDACNYNVSLDAQSTSKTKSVHSNKFIKFFSSSTLAESCGATVKSLDSGGYTLTWDTVNASVGFYFSVIAIKGPAAKVITTTQPASNTTNDLDAGFVPKAGICVGSMKTASETPSDHNRLTIGTWDEQDNMDSGGFMDENGQTTTDVDRYISNAYSIVNYNHAQTVVGRATVAAESNGIRETWTNTDGTQYAHSWLLLGDAPVTDFAEISVTGLSDNVITDGDTTPATADGTDFGSVTQDDSTVTRTFTVANSGALALTTETPTIPTGFTLTEGLATSIATSGNDTFSVRLDNSVLGVKHGTISFVNNDTTLNPFNFTVSGVVNAVAAETSTGVTSIISSGLSQLNSGNSLVSVAGARGLGASGTLITEITSTNRLDRTVMEPGAPIGVLDSRFEDRMDETSYYAGSGAYWGSAR